MTLMIFKCLFICIFNRFHTVIFLHLMTSHLTSAARLGLGIFYRKHPFAFSKWNFKCNMLFLITGMNFVTGLTAASFFTIHMKKMEILVSISKIRQNVSFLACRNFLVMALKTKCIIRDIIGKIKFIGKFIPEMFGKVSCVRIVTGAAVTFGNRTMQVLAFVNFILSAFHDS